MKGQVSPLVVAAGAACLAGLAWGQQRAASEFAVMDGNGDGKISRQEHAAGARKMFETMDADGNGIVTAAEMDAAQPQIKSSKPTAGELTSADKIKAVDQDQDGVLTRAEHAAATRIMFEKMDVNRDEALSADEMAAGHATMLRK
jgi:Ca2+-binding EF-hand superfamily protein